ncbi:MAG: hypothetical protein HC850_03000 [Rhodomicrobium sp.]|nr:hypothetical protein [Rhodomicrobium sp.]
MIGGFLKGIFGDSVGGILGKLFDVASLFVPQLMMIRTLDLIADTIKEGPDAFARLPQLLSQLGLPGGIAGRVMSTVSELSKGGLDSVLALPQLLRSFGIETPEILGEVTDALDKDPARRALLPGVLQTLGVPQELSRSITRVVDAVSDNNARIRAEREADSTPETSVIDNDSRIPIITDIIDSDMGHQNPLWNSDLRQNRIHDLWNTHRRARPALFWLRQR